MSPVEAPTLRLDGCGEGEGARGHGVLRTLLCLLGALMLASGCSLMLDTDRHQCQAAADCAKILGGDVTGYACTQNLCQTVVECSTNTDCMTKGKGICSANFCVECVSPTDCGDSPTAQCVANACKDDVWGCLAEADNRPAAAQPSATFAIKPTDPLMGKSPAMVSAAACNASTIDPKCLTPRADTTSTFDAASGSLTLSGLMNGLPVHLRLTAAPGPTYSYLPVEYYTNRPSRDTQIVDGVNMVPASVFGSISSKVPVDVNKASVNVRIHDCQGKLAPGVGLSIENPPPDLLGSYIDGIVPNFDLKATTAAGTAGYFNLPTNISTILTLTISPTRKLTFTFVPLGQALTLIDLYPRVFTN